MLHLDQIGKTSDAMLAYATMPFLRWQDSFGARA